MESAVYAGLGESQKKYFLVLEDINATCTKHLSFEF